ncbi:hypothetical protein VAPA_2c10380 [Variovorax paradoxus B4]|uniref:Uncharacterized protein n=2 Tax=Variovorax paradoxus TaxID=34073 RepID=A0A0H2MH50_VARPD|nr:DUF4286 family protein [Variovorax paradoxus]AGU53594.1 hypothetical protein VAPA_2c10380 [Variovorax paradoxus B4]KLN56155.1 hypothetical protein VPARA_28380 [Variovorax paradoxus]
MQDLWLLKHDASAADLLAGPSRARLDEARSWQAVDGQLIYSYLPGTLPPTPPADGVAGEWRRLACLQEVRGASASQVASHHYVVETDVLPEFEDELNAWYAQEHLPGLAAVPGTVRAARYVDAAGSPRYYACYDLAGAETLGSPEWLAVRATPWSARVRPAFRNTRRTMFRWAAADGDHTSFTPHLHPL